MLTILAENQSKEDELMKKCVFFFATHRQSLRVKESYQNLFQIGLYPRKTVKFAKFSKKQVCNVKKKQLQCLLLLRP